MIIKNIFSFILLMLFSFSSFAESQTSKWLKDDEVARLIESKQNAISAAFTKSVTVTSNGDVYIDGKKVEENNPSVQQLKSDPALLEQVRQYSWVSQTPPVSMTPNDRISQIVKVVSERFKIQTQNVGRSIAEAGRKLLLALCLITFIWNGAQLMIKGTDFGSLFFELFRTIMIFGFFYWLLNSVPLYLSNMCAKFGQWGVSLTGTSSTSDVFKYIIQETTQISGDLFFGSDDTNKSLLRIDIFSIIFIINRSLMALFILVAGYVMAMNLVVLAIEFVCTAWLGVFILGMAGSPWTRDSSMTYLRTLLAKSVKYFISILVISIGFSVIRIAYDLAIDDINDHNLTSLFSLGFAVLVVAKLAMLLPNQIAGFIANPGQSELISPNKAGAMAVAGAVGATVLTGGLAAGAVASSALAKAGAMTVKQVGSNMLRKGVGHPLDGVSFRQNYHQANEAKKKMKEMLKS